MLHMLQAETIDYKRVEQNRARLQKRRAGALLLFQPLEIGAMPHQPKPGYCKRHGRIWSDLFDHFQQVAVEWLATGAEVSGNKGAIAHTMG